MTLPEFPEFKEVELEDRDVFRSFLDGYPVEVCELNFGNAFIWRHYDHPRYTTIRGSLCILFSPPDEPPYFLQPVGWRDLAETIETCLSAAPRLSRIPESFAAANCPGFRCAPDRDNDDYVYAERDLAELKGKKYDGKRNRIRKFESCHEYRYIRLAADRLADCRRLFEEWAGDKAAKTPMAGAQRDAIQEALVHFKPLGLLGGAIEVGGRIEAFSVGEALSRDTAVIHIEIVSPRFEGLAQLMNREFVRNELSGFSLINREQDMGIPGLRRAKESYHPLRRVNKHHIWK
jgi:hypothetical protein